MQSACILRRFPNTLLSTLMFVQYNGFEHLWQYSGPWLWYLVGFYLCLPLLAYTVLPYFLQGRRRRRALEKRTVSLFVLGDIGHSPRMCYHARSLAKLDTFYVNVCGYLETMPPRDIVDDINIEIMPIEAVVNRGLPFILFALKKIATQSLQIWRLLWRLAAVSDFIMIQNPPSIPVLLLVLLYTKLLRTDTKVIVDWHNLNYSILNLKYRNVNHPLVKILRWYEQYLGRLCDYHITVTRKMKQYLVDEFGISERTVLVLHDRPADGFVPLAPEQKRQLLATHSVFRDVPNVERYKVLVSSTSFTADEDLNILLNVLKQYDTDKRASSPILLVVTGKGPLKPQFLARAAELKFLLHVIVKTAWLLFEDYPRVLACADLAVSLHSSSSGIDLPMKIVDFFGCGVPVITLWFPAIDELVENNVNGLVASRKGSEQDEIYRLLNLALSDKSLYDNIKEGAMAESKVRWNNTWDRKVGKKLFKE
jgi:beta-1,4-mannosyltransferase